MSGSPFFLSQAAFVIVVFVSVCLDLPTAEYQYSVLIGTCKEAALSKNTSITLGDHFDEFIAQQIAEGRYASASEVVRAALRLFEDTEKKAAVLRKLLEEGEQSGTAEYSYEALMQELDEELD